MWRDERLPVTMVFWECMVLAILELLKTTFTSATCLCNLPWEIHHV